MIDYKCHNLYQSELKDDLYMNVNVLYSLSQLHDTVPFSKLMKPEISLRIIELPNLLCFIHLSILITPVFSNMWKGRHRETIS